MNTKARAFALALVLSPALLLAFAGMVRADDAVDDLMEGIELEMRFGGSASRRLLSIAACVIHANRFEYVEETTNDRCPESLAIDRHALDEYESLYARLARATALYDTDVHRLLAVYLVRYDR